MSKLNGLPDAVGPYNFFVALSAFHKELRRSDLKAATYWLQILMDGGTPASFLAKYLWKIAGEELAVTELDVVNYITTCRAHVADLNDYHLYQMVTLFVRAKKWWECATSTEMRRVRYANVQEIRARRGVIRDQEDLRKVPLYVHDKHTTKGKALIAAGKGDRRWEGSWPGMWWRRAAYEIVAAALANETFRNINDVTWDEVFGPGGTLGPEFLKEADRIEADVC